MSKLQYFAAIKEAITKLRQSDSEITIVHHNDADGLCSAAVLQTALSRVGFAIRRIALERVHPPIVKRIHDQAPGTIIYVDLGGKAAPVISRANRSRGYVIILDHHHPEKVTDPKVLNLTTELFGLSGEMDIAATSAAYLFACVLDEDNRDMAYLGVVGAVGDYHDRDGSLIGENRHVLIDAMAQGQVLIEEANGREKYLLTRFGDSLPIFPFAMALTTLGAPGYFSGGPSLGFRMCLEGPFQEAQQKLEELIRFKKEAYDKVLSRLRQEGFRQSKHTQWFMVGDGFAPMGVKTIGEFCGDIKNEDFVDPGKYLVGFQNMPPEVPGLGAFDWSLVKVSMRVPTPLEKKVLIDHTMPGLAYLVPEAAKLVGGSIDACHDYSAATLIDIGREEELIMAMDELVEKNKETSKLHLKS